MILSRFSALRASGSRLQRGYATQTKPPNPTAEFYKRFTRPVAKVMVLAIFTYQLVYWGWVKLEDVELRSETDATIAKLEDRVNEYVKSKKET